MTPENPEAVITIIIAGIGYGIYIGGESLDKRRLTRADGGPFSARAIAAIKLLGGAMMLIAVLGYVGVWIFAKI